MTGIGLRPGAVEQRLNDQPPELPGKT